MRSSARSSALLELLQSSFAISAYQPPRRIVFQGRMGKMAPTIILTVEPNGTGSGVTRRVEMEAPGLLRLMAPFMGATFHEHNAGFLANLKRVLESRRTSCSR